MAGSGSTVDPNAIFNFDDMDASFDMDPSVFGEDTDANQGTTSHSGEETAGDASMGNPINHPFLSLGTPMTNSNYDPSLPIDEDNNPFAVAAHTTNDNSDPVQGHIQHQQVFQESVGFNQNAGLAPKPSQVPANASNVEEKDWFKLSDAEEDEAFNRLMEMSPEEFQEMMREFPDEETAASGLSSATPYATSKKRIRLNEGESAPRSVGGAPSTAQLGFEPQQIHQIRQIREAKSRQRMAINGLEKRVQDLEVDLAKAQSEAKDAYENGRMVALLGVDGEWGAREAKLRQDAQLEQERQINAIRNSLEGQIAEKSTQLDQYRAEAEEYRTGVEREAGKYKQAAKAEIEAQKVAEKVTEGAKRKAESSLSEKTRLLDMAKPYVEGLEKKIADLEREKANWKSAELPQPPAIRALEGKIEELEAAAEKTKITLGELEKVIERLNGANKQAENAHADLQRLFEDSQSYAKDLERKLANLKKEQSSKEAAKLQREEELQQSATEARKALEGKVKDLKSTAEMATRAEDKATQATKGLNEELRRLGGDLNEAQVALRTKTEELERARLAIKEKAKARYPQQLWGPVEQVNVEPSNPANSKTLLGTIAFTFDTSKEHPPSQVEMKSVHPKKSQRQLRPQRQPRAQPQPLPQLKREPEPEPEPKPTPPSQWGMFTRHFYPPVPVNRPRRIHIHAEEAIRNRFHIPLDKVHIITSKLEQIEDLQDGAGAAAKASLVIAAELTGLSVRDLKAMQSLRMNSPGCSSNPKSIMRNAQLETSKTLVDLLVSENRPAIKTFLDGASFPQSQGSSDPARDSKSQGTQTEALNAEAGGVEENIAVQEEEAVVQPSPKQSRWGSRLGFASLWKISIGLCLLWFVLLLLAPLPWSSPVALFFEEPDPESGWFDYVPPPSPWSSLIPNFSGWPVISKLFGSFFEDQDLESKWCGNIAMG